MLEAGIYILHYKVQNTTCSEPKHDVWNSPQQDVRDKPTTLSLLSGTCSSTPPQMPLKNSFVLFCFILFYCYPKWIRVEPSLPDPSPPVCSLASLSMHMFGMGCPSNTAHRVLASTAQWPAAIQFVLLKVPASFLGESGYTFLPRINCLWIKSSTGWFSSLAMGGEQPGEEEWRQEGGGAAAHTLCSLFPPLPQEI